MPQCDATLTVNPTTSSPYFCYALNLCTHKSGATHTIFKRDEMTAPSSTIVFCEEVEDSFSETSGLYVGAKLSGGGIFVFCVGDSEWLTFSSYCRQGNKGCSGFGSTIAWTDSSAAGDWNPAVAYHWWFFKGAEIANLLMRITGKRRNVTEMPPTDRASVT